MTVIIFKQFGSSKNLGFRKFTKKKIKHLSEVITQSVCAQVPLFQVYKKPNWGPSNGESYDHHTYICKCVCIGGRVWVCVRTR
jgi:hypothetical protein